jgi:putative transposase
MHLTLKQEATKPAGENILQQQDMLDTFTEEYNHQRPHQALDMQYPSETYTPSSRPYTGAGDLEYPLHDRTITVTNCGRMCFKRKKIHLSLAFVGQNVGVKEVEDKLWLISFMEYDLGFFDEESWRVEPVKYPFIKEIGI